MLIRITITLMKADYLAGGLELIARGKFFGIID